MKTSKKSKKALTNAQKLATTRKAFTVSIAITVLTLVAYLPLSSTYLPSIIVGCTFALGVLMTVLTGAAYFINYGQRELKNDKPVRGRYARTLSVLIFAALLFSLVAGIKTLGIDVADEHTNRFVYENAARIGAGIALLLILLLDAVQTGIYFFPSNKRNLKLDERQARERQEIFESSYKIGGIIAIIAIWAFAANSSHAEHIMQLSGDLNLNTIDGVMPDIFYNPLYVLVLTLFALPPAIAAWRKPKK